MPVEMAAIAFDGTYTSERELNNLHVSRVDPWVHEVAVLEHHRSGRPRGRQMIRENLSAEQADQLKQAAVRR